MTTKPARLLVVDDDVGALTLMWAALRKAGFEVSLARDGEDALRQCRASSFDLVMLDVDMPGLSGHEVCGILRGEAGPLLPILMVTGMDDLASVERAYQSGATDFLAKPINWALLGHRVKYMLRGHRTLLELQAAESNTAAILSAIPDLLFEVDLDGRFLASYTARANLLAAPQETFIGRTVGEVLPGEAALEFMAAIEEAHRQGQSTGRQYELNLRDGRHWFELSLARKGASQGVATRFIVLARDITERKQAERKILRLAYFDALTKLPNRQSFLHRVEREIKRAAHNGTKLGVLFMDLDGFKAINDTLGHAVGDQILQRAANRLRNGVRPADLVSRPAELEIRGAEPGSEVEFARLGGDEFTALILELKGPEGALVAAQRILDLMRRPFMVEGRSLMLTASIGIALYPDDGLDASSLLKHADTAMYHAKDTGRDNCRFYSATLTEVAVRRMELEGDLRMALARGEFHLVYQPLLDVVTGNIHGVEALIRWTRPGEGVVPPREFIPVAERSGMILDIGQWVLRTACADAARWQRDGKPLGVAVNVSALQFKDPELVAMVKEALELSGLPAHLLELELTESAVMADNDVAMATLSALRAFGVRIALDDFGTGYSSLSYLKRMPLNTLKIDRSFIHGMPGDGDSGAIVRAILAMAASLGLTVTAEGVETREQADAMRALACDSLQGYYFSLPVNANSVPALLEHSWPSEPG